MKQTIWGGDKIKALKGIDDPSLDHVGESWDISAVEGDETTVVGGEYDGMALNKLVEKMGARLVGQHNWERFGTEFPLLIKFIDARSDLSIQVHPNDDYAQRHGLKRGKTEMWYVMKSDPDARLLLGLKKKISPADYERMVSDGTLCEAIRDYRVKEDDCFLVPAGRVHAICAGTLLAEVQQTSNTTYRIFDYNRRDKEGHLRQLHIKEASECIDYEVMDDYQTHYEPTTDKEVGLVRCPHLAVNAYYVEDEVSLSPRERDSFLILIGIDGKAEVEGETLRGGQCLLIPAEAERVRIKGRIKMLEAYP